eukprot:201341_1
MCTKLLVVATIISLLICVAVHGGDIICEENQDCNVQCDASFNCSASNIDGSFATSLTINCGSRRICEFAAIQCPIIDNSSCSIVCNETWSCLDIAIEFGAHSMNVFELSCLTMNSCGNIIGNTVYRPLIISPTKGINSSIQRLSIICVFNACPSAQFDFSSFYGYIETLYVEYNGIEQILLPNVVINSYIYFHIIYAFQVNLDIIIGINAAVDIICNSTASTDSRVACNYASFTISSVDHNTVFDGDVAIYCVDDRDCDRLNVVAEYINIEIYCNGPNSCLNSQIWAKDAFSLSMYCNNALSCNGPNHGVTCPYFFEKRCQINCNNMYADSCQKIEITVPEYYRYEYLDLLCDEQCKSNIDLTFRCYDWSWYEYDIRVKQVYTDYLTSNAAVNNTCNGTDFSNCCPWINDDKIINCDHDTCTISCNEYDGFCINKLINGSNTGSLSVVCDANNICQDLAIICPETDNGECNIKCTNDNSCSNITIGVYHGIKTLDLYTLSIECSAVNNPCDSIQIYAPFVGHAQLECSGGLCSNILFSVDNGGNVLLDCKQNAQCLHIQLSAENANYIQVTAVGERALKNSRIEASNANSLMIICSSIDHTAIDNGDDNYAACEDIQWVIPDTSVSINCYGDGCQHENTLYLDSTIDASYIEFNINGCGICDDWDSQCLAQWNIRCNRTTQGYYESDINFKYDECENDGGSTDCGCSALRTQTKNNFVNDVSDNLCISPNITVTDTGNTDNAVTYCFFVLMSSIFITLMTVCWSY